MTPDLAGCQARPYWQLQHDPGHLRGADLLLPPGISALVQPRHLHHRDSKHPHRCFCPSSKKFLTEWSVPTLLSTVIHATGSKDSPRHTPFPAQTRGTHCVLSRGSGRQWDLSLLCRGELGVSCGKEHSPPRACSPLHGQRTISFLWNFPANPLSRARPQRGYSLFPSSTVFPDLLNTCPQTLKHSVPNSSSLLLPCSPIIAKGSSV